MYIRRRTTLHADESRERLSSASRLRVGCQDKQNARAGVKVLARRAASVRVRRVCIIAEFGIF